MRMKKLNEAANNVINRRPTCDDIKYFIQNMDANRYNHRATSDGFRTGYFDYRDSLLKTLRSSYYETNDVDEYIESLRGIMKQQALRSFGTDAVTEYQLTDNQRGKAYAHLEIERFLSDTEQYKGPNRANIYGSTV